MSTSKEMAPGETGGAAPRQETATGAPGTRLRPLATTAIWVLGVIVVFVVNLKLARTRAVNSDGAGNALQAWDMLHGNLLLHGWLVSDVPFYTTELPEYMLVELVRGLNQDVVHVCAAITYTLAMLLAALLAKGSSTGREGVVRAAVAAGIMLSPQLASGTNVLLSSPDHIGTSVPVLAAWLILDRARPRWYVPVIVGVILGWAEVADPLVLYIGVLPLVVTCGCRWYRAVVTQQRPAASQRYHVALGGAAIAAAAAGTLALHVIGAVGGFWSPYPHPPFAEASSIVTNLTNTVEGLLLLGGGDFTGLSPSLSTAFTMLHVVGVLLAGWGVWVAARRFLQGRDLIAELLVAGVVINLASYVLSTESLSSSSTREIAAVLPLSAVLAGRLLAGRLLRARLVPLLAVVLLGYVLGMVGEVAQPDAPPQNQQLTTWLMARHLDNGLSGYWESNVVTLTSGYQVHLRQVSVDNGFLIRSWDEDDTTWFNPKSNTANFVVLTPGVPGYAGLTDAQAVLATFGKPAMTYSFGSFTVLVWHKNLLTELHPPG